MNALKRKPAPAWLSTGTSTPGASSSSGMASGGPSGGAGGAVGVKAEPGGDVKRMRFSDTPSAGSAAINSAGVQNTRYALPHEGFAQDPRVAALDLNGELKIRGTMNYGDAYAHVQMNSPGMDPGEVLELLKGLERVRFNEMAQVFEYIPELSITSQLQLLSHIRLHTTPTTSLSIKPLREAIPEPLRATDWLLALEASGEVLISRTLGPFRDAELPRLGRKNALGYGILDTDKSAGGRLKAVFWDEVRSRGRGGKKVDDEFIHLWADVPIAETDDVVKLLAKHDLSAGAAVPEAPKPVAQPTKKKKKATRALKITNTHMKQYGIDLSKDYEAPT